MNIAVFCLAASLAVACAKIESDPQSSSGRQQGFNVEWSNEPTLESAGLPQKFASNSAQFGYPQYPSQNPPANPQYPPQNSQYPPQNPQYPQPAEPGRELPNSQDGSIKVRNDGLFTVLQFYVDYQLNGRKVRKESGKILTGLSRIITVPSQASEITVTVQYVGLFDITSDIHVRQFKYPVIRCYSSKDGRNVNEVGC